MAYDPQRDHRRKRPDTGDPIPVDALPNAAKPDPAPPVSVTPDPADPWSDRQILRAILSSLIAALTAMAVGWWLWRRRL